MMTKFDRLNRTPPERPETATSYTSDTDNVVRPNQKTGGVEASAGASYRPAPLDQEGSSETVALGGIRLQLLNGLRHKIAGHHDRRWSQFYAYWLQLAEARGALPSRQAIDPLQLPRHLLGNIFMTEVVYETGNQPRFRFRLLGQEISEYEYTRPGQYVHELGDGQEGASLEAQYLDCLKYRLWLRHTDLSWADRQKSFIRYDVLLLPLARDGHEVDAMIGLVIYQD